MADRVFLVHGMGHHPRGWHQDTEWLLRDFYRGYVRFNSRPFDDHLKIVPLNYDDVFRDLLTRWEQDSEPARQLADRFGVGLVQNLLRWADGADDVDDNFFWTHAFDVVMYRFLDLVREAVKVHVAKQINDEVETLQSEESWSILAHSLGTAVTHDTLHAWHTEDLGKGNVGNHFRPRTVAMVANVSRLLQTVPQVLSPDSSVRPGEACEYYYNVYHPLDPFTVVNPFKPVVWPSRHHHLNGEYRLFEVQHIQQLNIHALNHYLRHPDVIIPIFENLGHQVTEAGEADYRANFSPVGDLSDQALVVIRQQLESAGMGLPQDWLALIDVWKRYSGLLGGM